MARPSDEPIVLPEDMENVQDELNLVREQALRNAYLAGGGAEEKRPDRLPSSRFEDAFDQRHRLSDAAAGRATDFPGAAGPLHRHRLGQGRTAGGAGQQEFFDITRFNLTTLALEPERINLSRMLEQIASEFLPILAEKELRWRLDIQPGVEIVGDPDKLERVLDNLIRNAVNYSYAQTEIALSLIRLEDRVRIEVRNSGKTIPPDKLERLFEQFFG